VLIHLSQIVSDFAAALKAVDVGAPVGGNGRYKPGIGPLTEAEAIERTLIHLRSVNADLYGGARPSAYPHTRNTCDIVIPGAWAIEVKLARPFGDNGKPAERWSENLLYPYPGNTSSIGDALKLLESGFADRKAIMVLGYEHSPPKIPLEPAVKSLELIAAQVVAIQLGPRVEALVTDLIHPYHQQARVYGWEVLKRAGSSV